MAVIKSGNSTDQATVDPISKAVRVSLYDANGNANSVPLATSPTGAKESGGNLDIIADATQQSLICLLRQILVEMRIHTEMLADGMNIQSEQFDTMRNDPSILKTDSPNG